MPPRSKLAATTGAIFVLVLVAAIGRWFVDRWQAIDPATRPDTAWAWVILAGLILVLHASTAFGIWHHVMRAIGAELKTKTALDIFVPSLLARYIPGKVWANGLRLALSRRAGVRLGATTGAILWEMLIGLGSAGAVALFCLANGPDPRMRNAAAVLLAVAIGIWFVARALVRHPQGDSFLAKLGSANLLKQRSALGPAVPYSLLGWLAYGLAHLAIARAVAPVGFVDLTLITGAVALAWAAGYLAFVMPVGLGVRDGLLLVLLAPLLNPAQALVFVALSRLVQLATDASITGAWLVSVARRRSAPSA